MTQRLFVCCEELAAKPLERPQCCDDCSEHIDGESSKVFDINIAYDPNCTTDLGCKQCHDCGDRLSGQDSFFDPQGNLVCINCFESNYCICADCDEVVSTDDTHWVDHLKKCICDECRREYYVCCHDCEQLIPGSDGHFVDSHDYYVCQSCRDNDYGYCDECGMLFPYDQMNGDYCDECYSGESDERIYDYSYTPVYNFRDTYTDRAEHKLYLGFELEVEVAASISDACDEVDGFSYLYMKSDSSINRGFEIVSHPGTLNFWHQEEKLIASLLAKLKILRCNAEPQGLHVHISKGLMQESHQIRFQSFFDANRDFLPKVARRSECGYSKHKDLSHCDWKNAARCSDRYQAVNWLNPRTVEIRIFRGTLEINEFMASVEFCHAVYQLTKNQVSLATIANGDSWRPFCRFVLHDKRYPTLNAYFVERGIMGGRQCV